MGLERLGLAQNGISDQVLSAISTQLERNVSETRRSRLTYSNNKLPAVQTVDLDGPLADELDWRAEQLRRETSLAENELRTQHATFERVRSEAEVKYSELKKEYDTWMDRERAVDQQIVDFDSARQEVKRRSQSRLEEFGDKLHSANEAISSIEANCTLRGDNVVSTMRERIRGKLSERMAVVETKQKGRVVPELEEYNASPRLAIRSSSGNNRFRVEARIVLGRRAATPRRPAEVQEGKTGVRSKRLAALIAKKRLGR